MPLSARLIQGCLLEDLRVSISLNSEAEFVVFSGSLGACTRFAASPVDTSGSFHVCWRYAQKDKTFDCEVQSQSSRPSSH